MGFHVLLQVIFSTKWFTTARQGTREWFDSGVNAFMSGQLLVPSEGLATVWIGTTERTLS